MRNRSRRRLRRIGPFRLHTFRITQRSIDVMYMLSISIRSRCCTGGYGHWGYQTTSFSNTYLRIGRRFGAKRHSMEVESLGVSICNAWTCLNVICTFLLFVWLHSV